MRELHLSKSADARTVNLYYGLLLKDAHVPGEARYMTAYCVTCGHNVLDVLAFLRGFSAAR